MRVRGQALAEVQGAVLLAAILAAGIGGGIWWFFHGQLNLQDDLGRMFADTRAVAQSGTVTLQLVQSGNETIATIRAGSDPINGKVIRSSTIQGLFSINYSGGSYAQGSTLTFVVAPNGVATLAGGGTCPSNMALVVDQQAAVAMSCDPLQVTGY